MKLFYTVLFISALLTSCQRQLIGLFKKGDYIQKKELVEIPFTCENDLLIVPVEISGKTYRFLFDTGAPNVVSKELNEQLQFKHRRKVRTIDSQGNASVLDYVKINKLQLNDAEFVNNTAAVADLRQADAIACLNLDGIIGANLMREAVYWQIDFETKKIRLAENINKLAIPEGSYTIPFSSGFTGTPIISLKIGDVDVKKITFDTGSAGFLSIDNQHLKEVEKDKHIIAERNSFGINSVGLFGASQKDTVRHLLVESLSMGTLTVNEVQLDGKNVKSSLLGISFLKNFLVTIDWKDNVIYLSPRGEFRNTFAESFGISLIKEGDKMVVSMLTDGSIAQQMGIAIGDVVLRVNDIDVAHTTLEEYCQIIQLARMKETEVLQLVLDKDGKNEYFITKMPTLKR